MNGSRQFSRNQKYSKTPDALPPEHIYKIKRDFNAVLHLLHFWLRQHRFLKAKRPSGCLTFCL